MSNFMGKKKDINMDKEIITAEFTASSFMLLRSSGKYGWCQILNIPNTNDIWTINN